jgi:citronellol/citronellal dehydrogenase
MAAPKATETLKDRVALITGASRGIGKNIALALAKQGVNIVIAAKSTESTEKLPGSIYDTAKEVEALGAKALPIQCNVRNIEEIDGAIAKTIETFGRVDMAINNAGALWWKSMLETPPNRFNLVHEVNARASFFVAKACLPHMIEKGWGHVINMSPPLDMSTVGGHIAYFMSKYGMTMIAHGLAQEVRDHNIGCNALWPATIIESQASINWGLGDPSMWRKSDILADSVVEIARRKPSDLTGHALIDEDFLRDCGITDFDKYSCVPGTQPMRIVWDKTTEAKLKK